MIIKIISFLGIFASPVIACAQNVGIGTNTASEKLEVKSTTRSAVKVSGSGFSDTTQLILSNRNSSQAGTDFKLSSNGETGLRVSSSSDLPANVHDSIITFSPAGRIGINNINPSQRLDVRGNINVAGSILANGVDGIAGQVLMKNTGGSFTWGNINSQQYARTIGFKAGSSALSPALYNWTVPAGVTKIFLEAWGGGGGGAAGGGGGGGGYIAAEWTVTPGATININIAEGGTGATTSTGNGNNGGNTTITIGSFIFIAYGGGGAYASASGFGGRFSANSLSILSYGQSGSSGESSKEVYGAYSSTVFYTAVTHGKGGMAGNTSIENTNGGFRSFNTSSLAGIKTIYGTNGTEPGGGGGGDGTGFASNYGGPGLAIIHY
ncbi:MAG: hypothetical protein H7Y86_19320 [Rhizobacter sp.]|nr:hypothetical protein [Ferruginibacter sp.]